MEPDRPIATNPGGTIALADIVGRDRLCARVLATLEQQSVVLTGERRMGKTSLSRLVEAQAIGAGWTVVRQSSEGYTSLEALAQALMVQFQGRDGALRQAARALLERTQVKAAGVEIDLAPKHPSFEQVVEAAVGAADGRLLLVLDELPLFARALDVADPEQRPGTAALHLLRRLRESNNGLRMLMLGSVGFHHVVRNSSGVINDTARIRLGPLEPEDAAFLARCLFLGAAVEPASAGRAFAAAVEGVPYYIHKLVQALESGEGDRRVADADASALVDAALGAPDDPWDLRHYRDRLTDYFGAEAPLAAAVLDAVASDPSGADLAAIERAVSVDRRGERVDGDRLREILERLEDDHYVVREGSERRFAFELVRRAWIELRS